MLHPHALGDERQALLPTPRRRGVGVLSLVVIGFFWVSGGIYGNEELISAAPPLMVIAWTLGCALLFALPNALMTAELATAFPATGGQVVWVESACGSIIGAQNGFWVWITYLLDAAVYPQMASRYLGGTLKLSEFAQQGLGLAVVGAIAIVNLIGLDCVTATQAVAFVLSLLPCLLFSGFGLHIISPTTILSSSGPIDWALLLSWAVWLYSGFSSLGSMAGEVENPRRTYPLVVLLLLPLVSCLNILPFAVALSLDSNPSHYTAGHFAVLAKQLAGQWLETLFVIGANISLIGLYHSQVLGAERALVAFGERRLGYNAAAAQTAVNGELADGSSADAAKPPKRCRAAMIKWLMGAPGAAGGSVPRISILFNALCAGALTLAPYASLVEIEMMLYSVQHILFLYSFVALRVRMKEAERPFKLPGGTAVAAMACIPPLVICLATLGANLIKPIHAAAFGGALMVGVVGHLVVVALCRTRSSSARAEGYETPRRMGNVAET